MKAIQGKAIPWLNATDVPQQMVWNMDAGRAISELINRKQNHAFETVHMQDPRLKRWMRSQYDL